MFGYFKWRRAVNDACHHVSTTLQPLFQNGVDNNRPTLLLDLTWPALRSSWFYTLSAWPMMAEIRVQPRL